MGDRTSIEWTRGDDGSPGATWNPLVGCSRVSPGCDHCYAITAVHRGAAMGTRQHQGLTVHPEGERLDWNGEITVVEHLMDQPIRWKRPRRIFVNSLSDLFHPAVDRDVIARIFAVMSLAPQHTFQVLTKRSQRMQDLVDSGRFAGRVDDFREELQPGCGDVPWPLPNVWLGVSVESNRYAFRARHLSTTPAAVRWVSAEPLLGPLDELPLDGIDWIVVGGESGPGARPMHPDWVRDLRDRCLSYWCPRCHGSFSLPLGMTCDDHRPTRGPAFLFKQHGSWRWADSDADNREDSTEVNPDGSTFPLREGHGPWAHPDSAVTNRMSKKDAGRELDGRTWDEYPRA